MVASFKNFKICFFAFENRHAIYFKDASLVPYFRQDYTFILFFKERKSEKIFQGKKVLDNVSSSLTFL